jgi:hypothetical protein
VRLEHVGKEVMIAIPVAPVVEGDEKEVAAFQALQATRRVVLPKPAGAERSVSLRRCPASSCAIRRGRKTAFGGEGGI